jgi:hypothetical protein
MTIRMRKLIGTILLLAGLIPYWFLVVIIAAALEVSNHKWLEIPFYIVGGFAWVLPAAWLVRWMQKPDVATGE